jgi:hypothetical protein
MLVYLTDRKAREQACFGVLSSLQMYSASAGQDCDCAMFQNQQLPSLASGKRNPGWLISAGARLSVVQLPGSEALHERVAHGPT